MLKIYLCKETFDFIKNKSLFAFFFKQLRIYFYSAANKKTDNVIANHIAYAVID